MEYLVFCWLAYFPFLSLFCFIFSFRPFLFFYYIFNLSGSVTFLLDSFESHGDPYCQISIPWFTPRHFLLPSAFPPFLWYYVRIGEVTLSNAIAHSCVTVFRKVYWRAKGKGSSIIGRSTTYISQYAGFLAGRYWWYWLY